MPSIRQVRLKSSDTSRVNVYRCQFCNGYHFGHAPGSNRLPGRKPRRA